MMEVVKYAYTENEYIYYYTNSGLRTEDDIVRANENALLLLKKC